MSNQPQHHTVERRKSTRQKSFLRGMIRFNNRRSVLDCLIRDISACGARLIFSASVTTPDVLDLYIPQKEQTQRVRVIWRHGQEIGVAFEQPASANDPVDAGDFADRVARLEAELAALKKALQRLKPAQGGQTEVA